MIEFKIFQDHSNVLQIYFHNVYAQPREELKLISSYVVYKPACFEQLESFYGDSADYLSLL